MYLSNYSYMFFRTLHLIVHKSVHYIFCLSKYYISYSPAFNCFLLIDFCSIKMFSENIFLIIFYKDNYCLYFSIASFIYVSTKLIDR